MRYDSPACWGGVSGFTTFSNFIGLLSAAVAIMTGGGKWSPAR